MLSDSLQHRSTQFLLHGVYCLPVIGSPPVYEMEPSARLAELHGNAAQSRVIPPPINP